MSIGLDSGWFTTFMDAYFDSFRISGSPHMAHIGAYSRQTRGWAAFRSPQNRNGAELGSRSRSFARQNQAHATTAATVSSTADEAKPDDRLHLTANALRGSVPCGETPHIGLTPSTATRYIVCDRASSRTHRR